MNQMTRNDTVAMLEMSNRLRNCLDRLEIRTVGQLLDFPAEDWPNVRNMGAKTVAEVLALVEQLGGSFGNQPEGADVSEDMREADMLADGYELPRHCVRRILADVQKAHPDCGIETRLYYAHEDAEIRSALKGKLLHLLEGRAEGADIGALLGALPSVLSNTTIAEEILLELESAGKVRENEGRYFRCYPSALEFVENISDERKRTIIQQRLNGKTLEEAGAQFGLTRERVRQICAKVFDKCPRFAEDAYRDMYMRYEFSREDFCAIFAEPIQTYHYLETVCSIRGVKRKPLRDLLEDDSAAVAVKRRAEQIVYKDYLLVDGIRLPKSRTELFRHVVKTTCREKTAFGDVLTAYDAFLAQYGLAEDPKLIADARTYENRVQSCDYALWNFNRSLRYYNVAEREYGQLVATLGMEQFMDKEISALKLFRDNAELMAEYDIRDEYELHSLLRKIWPEWGNCDASFSKMPTINVGKPNRDEQVLDLLLQHAPISNTDLAQRYEEAYGAKAATVLGFYFKCIDDYLYQGIYSVNQESLTPEQYRHMQTVLTEDFYMLSEIQRLFQRELPGVNLNLANAYNIKSLGFQVYSNYAIRKTYASAVDYFRSLLLTEDVVDTRLFPNALTNIISYTVELYDLRAKREIVEFEPKKYINLRRLQANGITADILDDYCRKARNFVDRDCYFTITSLRQDGFAHELDDLYFDEWFYSSVLVEDHERFSYRRMGGTRLFFAGKTDVQVGPFLEWILQREERMEMDDLMQHLQERYGIVIRRDKLLWVLKDTSLYYDTIMDTVYVDYDTYFEEI